MNEQALIGTWQMFQRDHDVSINRIDRMLCDPDSRNNFLTSVRSVCGEASEKEILWKLMGLRKRKTIATKPKKPENFADL